MTKFKVKAIADYKTFTGGSTGTVLGLQVDNNSQPKLLIADGKGKMAWCEAEYFLYQEEKKQAQPIPRKRAPVKGPQKKT